MPANTLCWVLAERARFRAPTASGYRSTRWRHRRELYNSPWWARLLGMPYRGGCREPSLG